MPTTISSVCWHLSPKDLLLSTLKLELKILKKGEKGELTGERCSMAREIEGALQ